MSFHFQEYKKKERKSATLCRECMIFLEVRCDRIGEFTWRTWCSSSLIPISPAASTSTFGEMFPRDTCLFVYLFRLWKWKRKRERENKFADPGSLDLHGCSRETRKSSVNKQARKKTWQQQWRLPPLENRRGKSTAASQRRKGGGGRKTHLCLI